jgi:pathogenesis-related protein 1
MKKSMKVRVINQQFVFIVFLLAIIHTSNGQTAMVASMDEAQILLETHNHWRSEVGVPPLNWSDKLSKSALEWAISLEKKCEFKHSKSDFGENLWKGTTGAFSTSSVVNSWASEKDDYSYAKNKCKTGRVCGHYTQIVWKTTTKVGCAKMMCDGMTTWVCQYDPPGNWVGEKPY